MCAAMRWLLLAFLFGLLSLYYGLKARRATAEPAPAPAPIEDDDGLILEEVPERRRRRRPRVSPGALSAVFGVLAVVCFVFSFFRVVPAGNAGVPVTFGRAGHPVGPGLHLVWPVTSMANISTRTESITMSGSTFPDPAVGVLGKDGSAANANVSLIFRVNPSDATALYRQIGTGYRNQVIRPGMRNCVRSAFTKYAIVDAATVHFPDVAAAINICIHRKLDPDGIRVQDFQLAELGLSQQLQDSINAKLAAAQIQGTLTPQYLQYLYIKALQQFATSQNNTAIVVPSGSGASPQIVLPSINGSSSSTGSGTSGSSGSSGSSGTTTTTAPASQIPGITP
jgi:regulator of protease activity HflC (stomatin/prohibitin superfamily)